MARASSGVDVTGEGLVEDERLLINRKAGEP